MPAPDYAAEYATCRSRISALLADVTPAESATVVPSCPDWTVHDLCAHLAGVCASLVTRDNPGPDVQAWVDGHVSSRTERTVAELLQEWNEHGPAFEELMQARPRAFGGLVYDVVAHEHDLRGALGRPGDRDTDGVWASLEVLVGIIERDLAAKGPSSGTLVLSADHRTWRIGSGEPVVSLRESPWELMRLVGSRRTAEQFLAAPWEGDVGPFVDAIAHLPFPATDLGE